MFAAGMHVPVRQPALGRQLGRGAAAACIAGALAVLGGWVTARAGGVSHAGIYAVILARAAAAGLGPAARGGGLPPRAESPEGGGEGLVVAAQVAIADVAAIVLVPIVLQPSRTTRALLGSLAVSACAVVLLFVVRGLRDAAWVQRVRRLSKEREWALDLRLALL